MVSVIIPTYKRSEFIKRAVLSVFKQTYNDIEVIVVDDNGAGTDAQINTYKEIEPLQDRYNVRYIAHEQNKGACGARNTGIFAASGEYVGFLDDDDEWLPDFLGKMLVKMEDDSIGIVYSNYYARINGKTYFLPKESAKRVGNVYKDLLNGWCVPSTSFFLIRRECLLNVNGFDESLGNFEEYELWIRLAKKYMFDCCDEPLVIKEEGHSDEQLTINPESRKKGLDAMLVKLKKELNEEDYNLFLSSSVKWSNEIMYNTIVVGKKNKKKIPYFEILKEYWKVEKRSSKRLAAYLNVFLGYKFASRFRFFVLRATKKMVRVKL